MLSYEKASGVARAHSCAKCGERAVPDPLGSPGVYVHDGEALGARAFELNEDHAATSGEEAAPFGALRPGEHHIELAGGGYLDLADPAPKDIRLDDVAHGLSQTCRYAGQCDPSYSVAEHAVLVSEYLQAQGAPLLVSLAGLHHDDAEAYIGDMTRPLRALLPDYSAIEARVMAAIVTGLALEHVPFTDPRVKRADDWAVAAEAYQMLPSQGSTWHTAGLFQPQDRYRVTRLFGALGLSPREAKRAWLARHRVLTGAVKGR